MRIKNIILVVIIIIIIIIFFIFIVKRRFANPPIDFAKDAEGMLGNYKKWKETRDALWGPQLIDVNKYLPNTGIYEMIYPEGDYFGSDGPTINWQSRPSPYFGSANNGLGSYPYFGPQDKKINWKSRPYPLFLPDEDPKLSIEENLILRPTTTEF
jgi:hypothetical protein